MAMQSTSVLNSILAWSASHMSAFQPSYEKNAIQLSSSALQCLAKDLSDISKHETSLASCLILCAAASPSNQWYNHPEGAKTIIETAAAQGPGGKTMRGVEYFKQSQDGQWLLRDFSYHDIVGAVAMGREPLIKGKYWIANGQQFLDACMGLGSEVLEIISEICCLKREDLTMALGPYSTELGVYDTQSYSTWAPFLDIDSRLRAWMCTEGGPEYLAELAECHRLTALLCLYRKMRELFPQELASINSEISVVASLLSQSIEAIPYQSMAEAGLIFPVFMAGGDAEDEASIAMLRTRMQALQGHRGFKYISLALEVLEELWRLKLRKVKRPDGTGIHWRDIVQRREIKLMLF
ncbi:hypothetical protein N7540_012191 [Penicillium herquei]|nr:hypothetical protein N7540_012191 [Penicillium herquei]